MKKVISLVAILLSLSTFGCAGASVKTKVLTAEELVCEEATRHVKSLSDEANAGGALANKLEMEVEACGMIASTNMGYAMYHINGYTGDGIYLGHMKRLALYVLQNGKWVISQEGMVAFVPPPGGSLPQSTSDRDSTKDL